MSFITSIRSWGAQLHGSLKQFQSQLTHSCSLFLPLHKLHSPIYLCTDLIVVTQSRELEDDKEPTVKQQLAFSQLTSLDDVLHKQQERCRRRGKAHTAQATAEPICHQPKLSCTSTLLLHSTAGLLPTFIQSSSGRARHNQHCSTRGTKSLGNLIHYKVHPGARISLTLPVPKSVQHPPLSSVCCGARFSCTLSAHSY